MDSPEEADRKAALRLIHAVARDLGYSHEEIRELLGVESLGKLGASQLESGIGLLYEAAGQTIPHPDDLMGGLVEFLCDRVDQCETTYALWALVSPWVHWLVGRDPMTWASFRSHWTERERSLRSSQ